VALCCAQSASQHAVVAPRPLGRFAHGVQDPAASSTNLPSTSASVIVIAEQTLAESRVNVYCIRFSCCVAVAPAGYAQTSPTAATPCARSSYAPQFNRLAKCLRCQSGLEEPEASGLQQGDRANKRTVCSEYHMRWAVQYACTFGGKCRRI